MTKVALAGVELRHLAALSAIHHERSFRGAAERLGYVQSAVSQQLAQLESLVGSKLVERVRGDTRPVHLTEAGDVLLRHTSRIMAQLSAAQADLSALGSAGARPLRIGVDTNLGRCLVPTAVARLAADSPHVSVQLEEASSDRSHLRSVELGEIDAAFGEMPIGRPSLEATSILDDPCVLVVHRDSPLAAPDRVLDLADLVSEPLVTVSTWPMMELIVATLHKAGYEPVNAMRVLTAATAQALVGAGVGATIVPRLTADETDSRLAVIELGTLLPARRIVLYWSEMRQELPALAAFREAAVRAGRSVRQRRRADRTVTVGEELARLSVA